MADRICPRCVKPLAAARGKLMVVDMCPECGGAFFDHGELAKLARKYAEQFRKLEALVAAEDREPQARAQPEELRCPGCSTKMQAFEYCYCSGIRLEQCPGCSGVWVDDGELQSIADHILGGDEAVCRNADAMAPIIAEAVAAQTPDDRVRSLGAIAGLLGSHVWPAPDL